MIVQETALRTESGLEVIVGEIIRVEDHPGYRVENGQPKLYIGPQEYIDRSVALADKVIQYCEMRTDDEEDPFKIDLVGDVPRGSSDMVKHMLHRWNQGGLRHVSLPTQSYSLERNSKKVSRPQLGNWPHPSVFKRKRIVVGEDIADTGDAAMAVRDTLYEFGAEKVIMVAMFLKRHSKYVPDIVGAVVPNDVYTMSPSEQIPVNEKAKRYFS